MSTIIIEIYPYVIAKHFVICIFMFLDVTLSLSYKKEGRSVSDVFIGSPDHPDSKIGMCCFISTEKEGFMYDVQTEPKLLASYPYTAACRQVSG